LVQRPRRQRALSRPARLNRETFGFDFVAASFSWAPLTLLLNL
jgi:hypothetical protein